MAADDTACRELDRHGGRTPIHDERTSPEAGPFVRRRRRSLIVGSAITLAG
jgi:hypothetical protein